MANEIRLRELVELLDSTLDISPATEGKDAPSALNGLQVENDGWVHKVAAAVDGTQQTLEDAVKNGADLILLHHGLFWGGLRPITGWWRRKVRLCLENNLAVYSAHLPLDIHPTLGNNACIARELGPFWSCVKSTQKSLDRMLLGIWWIRRLRPDVSWFAPARREQKSTVFMREE